MLMINFTTSKLVAAVQTELQNCPLLTQSRNVCASAVCLFLTTKGLTIITSVCRMDSENSVEWSLC